MDVLYIPQLDEVSDGGDTGTVARYHILKRIPENGSVLLTDRSVTRIELATSDPLKIVLPPEVKGSVRDFFVRIVITADEVPEITFVAPSGETVSFEDMDEDVFACDIGVNIFAFTETDTGIFMINRKEVDIDHTVVFDPCGGTLAQTEMVYKLGAQYLSLPTPTMTGYVFQGWFTAAEGGIAVTAADRVKTGVTKLYAQWAVYVDPFVDAICAAKDLTFFSNDVVPWYIDETEGFTAPGAARSGFIGDSERTSLTTTVQGKGTLTFKWKVSSEYEYDCLRFSVDGSEVAVISGDCDWDTFSHTIEEDGSHTIEWKYDKDGSVADGSDCGWIDDVVWTPQGSAEGGE